MGNPPLMPDVFPLEGEALEGVENFEGPVSDQAVRVGWVTEATEALSGHNIMCRVGCLRIENRLVQVCLQGKRNFSQFSRSGGNMIDAVRASHPEIDALKEIVIAPGLGEVNIEEIKIIRDGSEEVGGPAVIQVRGRVDGSRIITSYLPQLTPLAYPIVTEYWLWPERSEIEIHSWIGGDDEQGNALALNISWSDFVVWSYDADLYYPLQKEDGLQATHTFVGAHVPNLSYRWRSLDQSEFSILSLPNLPFLPVKMGQTRGPARSVQLFKRVLEIGEGSISHPAHQLRVTGDVSDEHRPVHLSAQLTALPLEGSIVLDDVGEPQDEQNPLHRYRLLSQLSVEVWSQAGEADSNLLIAQARLNEEGQTTISLRPGRYEWRIPSWGSPVRVPFEVLEGIDEQTESITLMRPSLVQLRAKVIGWAESEEIGVKLILNPTGENEGRQQRILNCLGTCQWTVAPGSWQAIVTRGWHFSAFDESYSFESGQFIELHPELIEEIPFEGWSGGEFHQHSTSSLDSNINRRERILSNIVEGVGFMVPSDHDVLTDYPALVRELGWERYVGAPITGVEISPLSGHLGAYGLPYDVDHPDAAGGAVPTSIKEDGVWRTRWISEIVAEARMRGAEIIQVNHPRDTTGYFDQAGYQPDQPISAIESLHWTTDFDTVEVFNGASDLCVVMRDWIGLLNQGKRVVGVGNSDSHDLGRPTGYPRNYLPTQATYAVDITKNELVTALRGGRVSVGGGAYLDLPEGPLLGDTITGEQVTLRLRARTPSFSQLTQLRALLNGREIWSRTLDSQLSALIDFDEEITLTLEEEGSLIFFAQGPALNYVKQGSPTFAFTNPIWVDRNGNGEIESTLQTPPSFVTPFCASPESGK